MRSNKKTTAPQLRSGHTTTSELRIVKRPILLVDDESSLRRVLCIFLERLGYPVVTASGGHEAAERLARGERFSLVLTDMMMPDGDGFVVLDAARTHLPQTAAIVMTALPLDTIKAQALERGALQVIEKPFCLGALRDLLEVGKWRRAA